MSDITNILYTIIVISLQSNKQSVMLHLAYIWCEYREKLCGNN